MKTIDIEIALMEHFEFDKKLVVPNVTRRSELVQFETDMLIISNSGYASGVEIKVSKTDLKNDLKKWHWNNKSYYEEFKYFYYAVPEKLYYETKKIIPTWCGIIVVSWDVFFEKYKCKIIKKPTKLNNKKWTDKEISSLQRIAAMRIYNLKKKIRNEKLMQKKRL